MDNHMDALIVEDEVDICFLLKGILSNKNIQSTSVSSITAATNRLATQDPSMLFLDNNLPDGFGVDFINKIKVEHPLTKVIMITADDTAAVKEKAFKAGADYFIEKPFTRETINRTIDIVMAEHTN